MTISCIECGKKMNAIQTSHFKGTCTGQLSSLKEYRQKYPEAPIRSLEMRKKLAHSLEKFIGKWGKEVGSKKWEEYCSKLSKKNTLDAFLLKGKTEQDWKDYNQSRAITLKNMIKKYGKDMGTEKFDSYRIKQKAAGNTLEYFVSKYGHQIGSLKYAEVCAQKGITLENMVRVHGKTEGFIRYNSWLEKTKGNYISLTATQFVKDLVEFLPSDFIFHDGIFGKEFCIWDERPYFFDFVITHPVKKVIEFNGDFWHANPQKYSALSSVPLRGGTRFAKDIWEMDKHKHEKIKDRGFDICVIWESEYLANPQETIKKAIKWIMN